MTPCVQPDAESVQKVSAFPGMHKVSSNAGEGTHPSDALEYFLGKIKKINLFPRIPENDVSNIEDVPDSDSVNSHMLFDMVVEPAAPTGLERKRFRLPLANIQPRSHETKVERTASLSQSEQTVRIHNRLNQALGASPINPTVKTMGTSPRRKEQKVGSPPRSSPAKSRETLPRSVKKVQNTLSASQSEVIVHMELTKDNIMKVLDTPRKSAAKTVGPSLKSDQKKLPGRSSSAKTIGAPPRNPKKKKVGIPKSSDANRAATESTTRQRGDAKSASTECSARKKRGLFCQCTADDPHESTRVFMANGRELSEV